MITLITLITLIGGTKRAKAKKALEAKQKAAEPTELVIPEHLAAQTGDTEQQRQHKRKVVKRLKQDFKRRKRDTENEARKSSWQNFQKGLKGKASSGFMRGLSVRENPYLRVD